MDDLRGGVRPVSVRRIGSVDVEVETTAGFLRRVGESIAQARSEAWGFCNAHTVNLAARDSNFDYALSKLTLVNDGVGVDIASKLIYDCPFPDNLNGTDLTPQLLRALPEGTSVYLLGGRGDVVAAASKVLKEEFPNIGAVGLHHGYFSSDEGGIVAEMIAAERPGLVIVGMGQPNQELWAARYHALVPAPILCVGALIDRLAGRVPRAPMWMRRLRAEWLYRLLLEPRRLGRRYLFGNLTFLYRAWRQRSMHKGKNRSDG